MRCGSYVDKVPNCNPEIKDYQCCYITEWSATAWILYESYLKSFIYETGNRKYQTQRNQIYLVTVLILMSVWSGREPDSELRSVWSHLHLSACKPRSGIPTFVMTNARGSSYPDHSRETAQGCYIQRFQRPVRLTACITPRSLASVASSIIFGEGIWGSPVPWGTNLVYICWSV
jgi:hypothetical protein